ncbi:MAG: alcohol dehydrogenase family protein [Hyphomicrobiales bacterium]|nr:alcohol dehydrogenase family protein [Hyphomicrobiales bacterium]
MSKEPSRQTMRAMVLTGHGGPEKLVYRTDHPKPAAGADEVLVRVRASGLNNTDINTRTAWYSKSVRGATSEALDADTSDTTGDWGGSGLNFPRIQGGDVCGIVESVGANADNALIGRRVLLDPCLRDLDDPDNFDKAGYLGSERDGGFGEYVALHHAYVHPIESSLSDAELATFPIAYVTAENMLERAQVTADDVILVTGASGGVGSALIQLAKRRGARVVAQCSASKHDAIAPLGADALLGRDVNDLAAALQTAIGRPTVTVVADVVGGAAWQQLINVLSRRGRYTCAGAIAGAVVEFDLRVFYLHDLTFTGTTISPAGMFARLVKYIERGEVRPLLAATYPLEQLREAQAAFVSKKHVGNIVVTVSNDE